MSASCVNENVLNTNESNNDSLYGFSIIDRVESAIVLHDWPEAFMAKKIVCSFAPRAEWSARDEWDGGGKWGWQRVEMDVMKLRTAFAKPIIKEKKGGNIFAPCELKSGAREKKSVQAIYAMTFDVDNGQTEEDLIRRLEEFGACYITYTSHSNGKTSDLIKLKKLRGFDPSFSDNPSDEDIRRFLVAPRYKAESGSEGLGMGYWPAFAATAKVNSLDTNDSGEVIGVKIKHDPISKMRIVLPLDRPFVIDEANRSRSENEWKATYVHIANKIGVSYDRSCTDVTRGFYAARTKALDNYRSVIGGTTPFVLPEVTPEMLREAGLAGRSSRAKSHKAIDFPHVEGEPDFEDFLWRHGSEFDVTGYLDALGWNMKGLPDPYRKSTIECPNDALTDAHTDDHWPDDTGCVAMPPDVADSGKAVIHCEHNGCLHRNYNTADYLRMIWQAQNAALAEGSEPLPAPEEFVFEVVEDEEESAVETPTAQPSTGASTSAKTAGVEPKPRSYNKTKKLLSGTRFALKDDDDGTRIETLNKDGEPVWVCSAFNVLGSARENDSDEWGVLIEFYDDDDKVHQVLINMSELKEKPGAVCGRLAAKCFDIYANARTDYFYSLMVTARKRAPKRILTVHKPGWVNDRLYVAPDGSACGGSDGNEPVRYDNPPLVNARAGTLEKQVEAFKIALEHGGVHHLIGILAGCAGVVVDFIKADLNPLVAFTGDSRYGKTMAMLLGTSSFSKPIVTKGNDVSLIRSLDGTVNAPEAWAEASHGSFLGLDEAQRYQSDLQQLIFKIASGSGRGRLTRNSDLQKTRGWYLFALMSAERGVSEIVEKNLKEHAAVGMTARLIDIDVTQAKRIPDSEFQKMNALLNANYGHAGPHFAKHLISANETPEDIRAGIIEHVKELVGGNPTPLIRNSAWVFGLLLEVGGIMVEAGLLPKGSGIRERIGEAWNNYLSSAEAEALKPGDKSIETLFENLFVKMGNGVYELDDHERHYSEALAWYAREGNTYTFYVRDKKLPELAGGSQKPRALAKVLKEKGFLIPATNANMHTRLPFGGTINHYKLTYTVEPEAPPAF